MVLTCWKFTPLFLSYNQMSRAFWIFLMMMRHATGISADKKPAEKHLYVDTGIEGRGSRTLSELPSAWQVGEGV